MDMGSGQKLYESLWHDSPSLAPDTDGRSWTYCSLRYLETSIDREAYRPVRTLWNNGRLIYMQ